MLTAAVSGVLWWLSDPESSDRWMLLLCGALMLIPLLFLLFRAKRQIKEITRTGDYELLDDAYREHVVDKGSYIHTRQVKTWMWVVPLVLMVIIGLGLILFMVMTLE